jgi:hypothetical protein
VRVSDQLVVNWWLVANHMKHAMMTVRREPDATPIGVGTVARMAGEMSGGSAPRRSRPSSGVKTAMTVLTFAILGAALVVVVEFAM